MYFPARPCRNVQGTAGDSSAERGFHQKSCGTIRAERDLEVYDNRHFYSQMLKLYLSADSVLFRPYERYWNKKYFPKVLQSAGFFLAVVDDVWFVKFDSGLRCDEFNNLINLTYIHMYHFE
mmetsp:Transcript_19778/g.33285  ORF Transcript_19778/g.33285 Transcript_19778/m.33285 type:complete len:121 (-) Transcript_19778:193-555(-)